MLSPQEVRRRLFGPVVSGGLSRSVPLRNGGQLYLDVVGHPEYATPDCGNALDLVVHDKAGERILEGLLEDAGQRLREEGIAGDISVLKSNAAPAGNSYGCHENYVVGRRAEFGRLADILIPFLITRQLSTAVDRAARDIDIFEAKTVPHGPRSLPAGRRRPRSYRTATSPGPPHGLVWRNGHRPTADPASVHAIRTSSTYRPPRKNSSRRTPSAVKPHDS